MAGRETAFRRIGWGAGLLERESELAAIDVALESAREGEGRLLYVEAHGPDDVIGVLDWFAQAERPPDRAAPPVLGDDDPRAETLSAWGQRIEVSEEALRRIPLFERLMGRELELVMRSASEIRVDEGETVVQRWHGTRRFYAILEGSVEIQRDGETLALLDVGQFFGELAALDWGAGFSYVRTATVVAKSPARLLVLPPAALTELVRAAPEVERQIRTAARERLQRV